LQQWGKFFVFTAQFSRRIKGVRCDALNDLLAPVEAPHAGAFFSIQDFAA
jgi:hypothetical protein